MGVHLHVRGTAPAGKIATLAVALLALATGCSTLAPPPATNGALPAAEPALVVGLYPYVPRVDQFQRAISETWSQVRPEVALRFLTVEDWDGGYSDDPPPEADVYVFDAMFFEYFRSQGWLEPMRADEIEDLDDFVAYAIAGVEVDGDYFAIPQLGCANILFYQRSDTALADAVTLSEVEAALSRCTYTSKIPPDRRGLMVDMAGGTTNAGLYLDALNSLTGEYPLRLPWTESEIDPAALGNVRLLLAMASYPNGTASLSPPYERGKWFSSGWGRAVLGFTESMSAMSPQTRAGIRFKVMPLSDDDRSAMFYADVIAVNTTTRARNTRALAVQLANVMASTETMVASIGPDRDNPDPQYLMATRPSVFQTLGRSFPIYNDMVDLIATNNPILFALNERSREWLAAMKDTIRKEVREDYPCGCDYRALAPIADDASAPGICDPTCADHGGWTGSWTSQYPAAPAGTSACGCKACPLP